MINISKFTDPLSAIDLSSMADYEGVEIYDGYYLPPVSLRGLCQLKHAHPQHGRMPKFRTASLMIFMEDNTLISYHTLKNALIDMNTMGNGYIQLLKNRHGVVVGTRHVSAINVRRLEAENHYGILRRDLEITPFKKGEIYAFKEFDSAQQIYGLPSWFGALQSILLSENVRLFSRRFFKNNAQVGKIIATSGLIPAESKAFKKELKGTKGEGNWSTMHVNLDKNDIDKTIKSIDLAEDSAKIDVTKLTDMSATDVMEAWGVRPELAGMMPENHGGTGDLEKIQKMYYQTDTLDFIRDVSQINEVLPTNHQLKFKTWNDIHEL